MAKRKQVVVEQLEFSNLKEAQETKLKCEKKLAKVPECKKQALIGTALPIVAFLLILLSSVFGEAVVVFFLYVFMVSLVAALVIGIAVYIKLGGFGVALKAAGKITKASWYIIPVFPADIIIAMTVFVFSLYALLFLPIIILNKIVKEIENDYEAAEEYIKEKSNM